MNGPSLSLEGYARVRAEMEAGHLRDGVLARAGVSLDEWGSVQLDWLEKMGAEIEHGRFDLTNRYTQAFLERQSEIASPTRGAAPSLPSDVQPSPPRAEPHVVGPAVSALAAQAFASPSIVEMQAIPTYAAVAAVPAMARREAPAPVAMSASAPVAMSAPAPVAMSAPAPVPAPPKANLNETGGFDVSVLRAALPFMKSAPPPAAAPPAAPRQAPSATPPIAAGQAPSATPPIAAGQAPSATPPIAAGQALSTTPPIAAGQAPSATPPIAAGQPPSATPPIAATPTRGALANTLDTTSGLPRDLVERIRRAELPFARSQANLQGLPTKAPGAPAHAPAAPPVPPAGSAAPIAPAGSAPATAPPADPQGPPGRLTLEQYAALCAELAASPQATDAVFTRYGLVSSDDRSQVDLSWRERLRRNPVEYKLWQDHYQRYLAYWQDRARRPGP